MRDGSAESGARRARCVLHIGMHKTGSSALQHFLLRNRHVLALAGIDLPLPRDRSGRRLPKRADLFAAIAHEKDHGAPHPEFGASAALVAGLAASMRPGRTTLLSAEGLSGPDPAFARALAPLAQAGDLRVVMVVRRADLWAESFYRQMVVSREVREARPFRDWLADPWTQAHLDRARIVGWWRECLPEGGLRVVHYTEGAPILPAFLAAAGLPGWLRHLPRARVRVKPGLHPGLIERLRRANAAGTSPDRLPPPPRLAGPLPGYFTPDERAAFLSELGASALTRPEDHSAAAMAPPPVWDGRAAGWPGL